MTSGARWWLNGTTVARWGEGVILGFGSPSFDCAHDRVVKYYDSLGQDPP